MTFLGISLCSISCLKGVKKEGDDSHQNRLEKEYASPRDYQSEGFISRDLFRIIIIEPKGDQDPDSNAIENRAKRRALSSLRHYLTSKNRIIGRNVNAKLLNMINQYGTLRQETRETKGSNIYFFEVEKTDIKQFVDDLSVRR